MATNSGITNSGNGTMIVNGCAVGPGAKVVVKSDKKKDDGKKDNK